MKKKDYKLTPTGIKDEKPRYDKVLPSLFTWIFFCIVMFACSSLGMIIWYKLGGG